MPPSDTYYQINLNTPKNPFILEQVRKAGGVRALAKYLKIPVMTISDALNCKSLSTSSMLKIAKFYGKDTLEIFERKR